MAEILLSTTNELLGVRLVDVNASALALGESISGTEPHLQARIGGSDVVVQVPDVRNESSDFVPCKVRFDESRSLAGFELELPLGSPPMSIARLLPANLLDA